MTPRSSAISGSSRSSERAACVEHRPPRPALPRAAQRVPRARGHRPVGDEAAEVVDPREVEELEGALEPRGPPPVAAALHRRPVVERVAPQLALVGVGVGRGARDGAALEQLRVRAVVGAAGRDVDRDVADDLHAALGRVGPQRSPLAVEADLVGDRPARAEARPVLDPRVLALAEVELLGLRHGGVRLAQQAGPGGERGGRLVGRAMAVRRSQRQHLPPLLAGLREPVDPGVGLPPEAAAGQRSGVQLHAAGTW